MGIANLQLGESVVHDPNSTQHGTLRLRTPATGAWTLLGGRACDHGRRLEARGRARHLGRVRSNPPNKVSQFSLLGATAGPTGELRTMPTPHTHRPVSLVVAPDPRQMDDTELARALIAR